MFDSSAQIKAMTHFLKQIANNKEGSPLTHKEVRAYARLMLRVVPDLFLDHTEPVQFLLMAMAASGLAHYDRSFAAKQIIKLLDESERRRSLSSGESF
ncbi:MAG: hypothetical protein V7K27_19965 [Nostoc sp.]|uniref:hypothetical protein n=1 Tax=Nostoc sp. TaxID=1180 RepID=UPI002FF7BBBE